MPSLPHNTAAVPEEHRSPEFSTCHERAPLH